MKPHIHPDYRLVLFHDTAADAFFLSVQLSRAIAAIRGKTGRSIPMCRSMFPASRTRSIPASRSRYRAREARPVSTSALAHFQARRSPECRSSVHSNPHGHVIPIVSWYAAGQIVRNLQKQSPFQGSHEVIR